MFDQNHPPQPQLLPTSPSNCWDAKRARQGVWLVIMSDSSSASNIQEQTPKTRDMSERLTKLIEDHQLVKTVSDYLTNNPDFTVVGVIGPQGVGKSTIINYTAKDLVPVLSTFYPFQHCVEIS